DLPTTRARHRPLAADAALSTRGSRHRSAPQPGEVWHDVRVGRVRRGLLRWRSLLRSWPSRDGPPSEIQPGVTMRRLHDSEVRVSHRFREDVHLVLSVTSTQAEDGSFPD